MRKSNRVMKKFRSESQQLFQINKNSITGKNLNKNLVGLEKQEEVEWLEEPSDEDYWQNCRMENYWAQFIIELRQQRLPPWKKERKWTWWE